MVVAGRTELRIDDTTVSQLALTKDPRKWLISQFAKWKIEDPSEETNRQLNGIV